MEIIHVFLRIVFVLSLVFLVHAFDRIIRYQMTFHRKEWLDDGGPSLIPSSENKSVFAAFGKTMILFWFKWPVKTPGWAAMNKVARSLFLTFRVLFFTFLASFLALSLEGLSHDDWLWNARKAAAKNTLQQTITIKGTIANVNDVKKFLSEETHLQMIYLGENEKANHKLEGYLDRGALVYESDLPKIPVPDDGFFLFKLESLTPGRYTIAAQRLDLSKARKGYGSRPFLSQNNQYIIIGIPNTPKSPPVFEFQSVTIPLPE